MAVRIKPIDVKKPSNITNNKIKSPVRNVKQNAQGRWIDADTGRFLTPQELYRVGVKNLNKPGVEAQIAEEYRNSFSANQTQLENEIGRKLNTDETKKYEGMYNDYVKEGYNKNPQNKFSDYVKFSGQAPKTLEAVKNKAIRDAQANPEEAKRIIDEINKSKAKYGLTDDEMPEWIKELIDGLEGSVKAATTVMVATQTPSTTTTQTKPTRWTKTVVRKYNALQESLITTGRTWGATDLQLQKIMRMDPDKLWELGNAYKSYFDELFEYVETDIEYNIHGHPGLQKIIDKYEERYGEIIV